MITIQAENAALLREHLYGLGYIPMAEAAAAVGRLRSAAPVERVEAPGAAENTVESPEQQDVETIAETKEPAPEPKRRGRKPKDAPAPEAASADNAPPTAADDAPREIEVEIDWTKPSIDDCRATLQAVISSAGLPAAKEILAGFGAGKMSEVKPEDYALFAAKCKELGATLNQ